ncbi:hypothetical protein FKM82_008508 [Ascaphus truei]
MCYNKGTLSFKFPADHRLEIGHRLQHTKGLSPRGWGQTVIIKDSNMKGRMTNSVLVWRGDLKESSILWALLHHATTAATVTLPGPSPITPPTLGPVQREERGGL